MRFPIVSLRRPNLGWYPPRMERDPGSSDRSEPRPPPGGPALPARPPSVREQLAKRPAEEVAEALKERVYASFTGLAIVLVQLGDVEHLSPERATLDLAIVIVGITAAGFAASVVAYLAVHAAFPDGKRLRTMLRVAGEALASASLPLILLVLAWLGVFELRAALWASTVVYLLTLALIGYLAVRRTRVEWWKQAIALAILLGLGLAVVGIQQLAHAE